MSGSLTKEIIFYSIVPISIVTGIIFILLLKEKKNNNYKYDSLIKVLLTVLIGLILSIMIGYTLWVYKRTMILDTMSQNTIFMILLAIVVILLFILLVAIFFKLYKNIGQKKEFQDK